MGKLKLTYLQFFDDITASTIHYDKILDTRVWDTLIDNKTEAVIGPEIKIEIGPRGWGLACVTWDKTCSQCNYHMYQEIIEYLGQKKFRPP